MRPSRRLLWIAVIVLAVSMLAIGIETVPDALGLYLYAFLGAAIVADLLLSRPYGKWVVDIDGPQEIFTGEPQAYRLTVSTSGALPDDLRGRLGMSEGLLGPSEVRLAPSESGAKAELNLRATRRGQWPLDLMWLIWPSRLRLLQMCPRLSIGTTIKAVPNIRAVQSGQIDVTVRSTLYGTKENILKGDGSEFHQLREWVTGMDPRTIDWKHSARHRSLMAKEMRSERNHHVVLALDNGFLMREEIAGLAKIDHAVNAALACAWAAGIGGDLVGLYAFDSQPRLFLPPEPGRAAFAKLRARTAELSYRSVETNHTLGMAHLHTRLKRRSLVIVFSDFVDTTTAELLVENLSVLNKSHVIVFVAIRDPSVEAIAHAEPNGMEDVARAVSAAQLVRDRQVVIEKLHRMGIFVIDVPPDRITARLVSTYLTIKSREII